MGCLFGYCGVPDKNLLNRMADILSHRCQKGWEDTCLKINHDYVVEIGHGIPPWSTRSHVSTIPEKNVAFGYSGTFFRRNGNTDKDDASHLVALFGLDSETKLQSFEGAYVAALARGKELILVRDHAGVKVLYWIQHKNRLVFASEIKALFADPQVSREMRIEALPEYLTFSFIPGEGTMFKNIKELQPGTTLKYRDGHVSVHRHFVFENLEWNGKDNHQTNDYARELRTHLESSVRECCTVSHSPPAVFLSGGIDSSAVLAVTARMFPELPIKTFSIHFGNKYANENEFVSMMVDQYKTDHTWLDIRPSKFLKRMHHIIWILDDPIGDPITVPNYLLAEAAARQSTVVLNGEGGDPCFGGPKNIPMCLSHLYGHLPGESEKNWLERNYLLSYKKCFSDLTQILNPDVVKESGGEAALISLITDFFKSDLPVSFLNKLMTINIRLKGANLILVKVDKMSSANGVLALPPLFSKRMIEASIACPPHFKLIGNIEKGVLKRAASDIVPSPIVQRPKSGMMVPVRFWFRREMRRYVKKILSRKNLNHVGFFNPSYIRKLIHYDKNEIRGSRHGLKLWMLITFMLWYEQMIDGKRIT